MRGYVVKKKKAWYIVLEMDREGGGRRQKWVSPRKQLGLKKAATKKQAEELLVKLLGDLQQGIYVAPNAMTVGELLDRWMEVHGKHNLAKTTYDMYESHIRKHIKPEIGSLQVSKVKPLQLQEFYGKKLEGGRADGRAGGLAARTIGDLHKILCAALGAAVTWEITTKNAANAVSPPKVAETPQPTWTAEVAQAFLTEVAKSRLYPLYVLAIATGMRRGELLGLRWQDIDWDKRHLTIVQALVATKAGPKIADTKTGSSRRAVAISEDMLGLLKIHQMRQAEERMLLGNNPAVGNLVFTSERGTTLNPRNLLRHFHAACTRAGVPKIPFHALRHTHATIMLKKGVHPKIVSERLGHSRVAVTMDVYSHVLPSMQAEVAGLVEQAVLPEKNKTSR